jgi:inosine/xanthosine triphosphatase
MAPIRVIVASQNPVKVESVKQGIASWLDGEELIVSGVEVSSGISHQPMTDAETYQGARNRTEEAMRTHPEADYWAGIEGGVEDLANDLVAFAWVIIRTRKATGIARSAAFVLPPAVTELVRQGIELGEADDILFARVDSKRSNGAVGLLTGDRVTRTDLYAHAVVLAMTPLMNPDLYT